MFRRVTNSSHNVDFLFFWRYQEQERGEGWKNDKPYLPQPVILWIISKCDRIRNNQCKWEGTGMNKNQKRLLGLAIGGAGAILAGMMLKKKKNEDNCYKEGYDRDGYDINGYDKEGYDRRGFNKSLYSREGIDITGKTYSDYVKISEELKEQQKEIEQCLSKDSLEKARFLLQDSIKRFMECFSEREEYRKSYDKSEEYLCRTINSSPDEYSHEPFTSEFWCYELSDREISNIRYMMNILSQKKIARNQFAFLNDELLKLSAIMKEKLVPKGITEDTSDKIGN